MRLDGGGSWVVGEDWIDNPALVLARCWTEFLRLWFACRGESGIATWPDAGGVASQAAWIVDAFATLASAEAQMDERRRQQRGG